MFRNHIWVNDLLACGAMLYVGYFFYGHLWVGLLFLPLLWWVHKEFRREKQREQERIFLKSFGDFLQGIATGLSSGYSFEHAFLEAERELRRSYGTEAWIVKDLKEIRRRLKLQEPLEQCLRDWVEMRSVDEMRLFLAIVASGRRRGGNVNGMIRHTAETLAERIDVEEEIHSMLTGKILEYRVMCIMPLAIMGYVGIASPGYYEALYDNLLGIVFMTMCLGVYVLGIYLGKRSLKWER